jgi:replicative DNA helicase
MFTHYPWVSRYGDDGNSECYLELIVAKNRYGNTNLCKVGYDGILVRYTRQRNQL